MKNLSFETLPESPQRVEAYVYRDSGLPAPDEAAGYWYGEPETAAPAGVSEDEVLAREERARAHARQETRQLVWEEARQHVEQELHGDLERRLELERDTLQAELHRFAAQRQDYFHQLEREMVQLTLAIARKVLQREAQIDPLLLAGTVRVALDQVGGGAGVELCVPPSQLAGWEARLRQDAELKPPPRLRADAALEPAGCRLQTETGSSDLSLEAQMGEIEQGFLDLLSRRPRALAAS